MRHRVLRDRLSSSERYKRVKTVIEIWNESFQYSLDDFDQATRMSCRLFLRQVIGLFSYCSPDTYSIFANASLSDFLPALLYDGDQMEESTKVYVRNHCFSPTDRRTLRTLRGPACQVDNIPIGDQNLRGSFGSSDLRFWSARRRHFMDKTRLGANYIFQFGAPFDATNTMQSLGVQYEMKGEAKVW